MRLRLLATGVVSLLGQVILLRELNVAFYGTELIYILALGFWLLWTAVGVTLGRRAYLPPAGRVQGLLIVVAWVLPLEVVLVRGLRPLCGGVPGAYLGFPAQMAAMALALLPVGVVLGLLFQWAAKLYVGEGRTLAGAYAVESLGTVTGGILATLFLKAGIQNFTASLLCALLALAAAVFTRRRGESRQMAAAGLTGLLLAGALVFGGHLDRALSGWTHPDLVETADSPYGRVTVTERAGQLSVFENDVLAFESEGTAAEEFVHLAAVQRAAPESVLMLGGGLEGLVEEMLQHHPARIDYVELNRVMVDLVASHLPPTRARALRDDAVRVTIADPRRFLEHAGVYDLILVGMPGPGSGQTNRFYTVEFFRRCAAHLSPDGVLALRLQGAENLWTPQFARRTASIERALATVFADVVILPGTTQLMLASPRPLVRDPAVLSERLISRGIEARLVIPEYIDYLYTNDRFFEIPRRLATVTAPMNQDARPICYQLTLLVWLSKFFPVVAVLDLPELRPAELAASPWVWIGLAASVALLLVCRRRPVCRRSLLVAGAGFTGMVIETALILNYQTTRGVLYQDLGLLLTLFMAGLALGAGAVDRWARRGGISRDPGRRSGFVLVGGLSALGLLTAGLLAAGAVQGPVATGTLLAATGFLVAAIFAQASLHRGPGQREIISPLYAADLVGGCLGSLAASLVLIPTVGMTGAGLASALVAALAALAL
jgi:spermidine synthase